MTIKREVMAGISKRIVQEQTRRHHYFYPMPFISTFCVNSCNRGATDSTVDVSSDVFNMDVENLKIQARNVSSAAAKPRYVNPSASLSRKLLFIEWQSLPRARTAPATLRHAV